MLHCLLTAMTSRRKGRGQAFGSLPCAIASRDDSADYMLMILLLRLLHWYFISASAADLAAVVGKNARRAHTREMPSLM